MNQQEKQVFDQMREALEQAHDMVDHWGLYASEYFQKKHDLAGDLSKIKAALTASNAVSHQKPETTPAPEDVVITSESAANAVSVEQGEALEIAEVDPLSNAMKTVIQSMQKDPEYAWSWHCNIAMAFVDAGGDRYTGNQGAMRFMKMLANVEPAHELPSHPQATEPQAQGEAFPTIQLGFGKVEVAEGWLEGAPALIFGKNGTGVIGGATEPNREHKQGETLAVVTFANVESLDVVLAKLGKLRADKFLEGTP